MCGDSSYMLRPDGNNAHSLIINVHASKRDCVPLPHTNVLTSDA